MKKAIFFFLFFTSLFAQNREPFKDKKFQIFVSTLWLSTIYDNETTILAINKFPNSFEINPFLKPIMNSKIPDWKKRIGIYSFNFILNNLVIGLSARAFRSNEKQWYISLLLPIISHSISGSLNLRIIL